MSEATATGTPAASLIQWEEAGQPRQARWRSEGAPATRRVTCADDTISADRAYKLACEGTALLWRGDFQNARQLLQALARRVDRPPRKPKTPPASPASPVEAFYRHRQAQARRARILGMLLVELDADYGIALRRAPDVRAACEQAWGAGDAPSVMALRELLGIIGAFEWRKKGVDIPALGERIHPWYGVFSPVRGEYVDLVAQAPLPSTELAFDIGAGTGVLAAVLARRGVRRVVATDQDPRALGCALENLQRLGLAGQVEVVQADLFPQGRAPLIVCNPPWLPGRPSAPVEYAIFDPDSRMLHGFLNGLQEHLAPGGEAWLILSDLAEHLGLRSRQSLLSAFDQAGLVVRERLVTRPRHPKSTDPGDPLHAARAREITSLWRLALR